MTTDNSFKSSIEVKRREQGDYVVVAKIGDLFRNPSFK